MEERVRTLSQFDEEPIPDDMTDGEIINEYGYEVREVSEKDYKKILNSDEYGLLKTVFL